MINIKIPQIFQAILSKSELLGPVTILVGTVAKILQDNKMAFFPDYTDHGIAHVNSVLDTAAMLIPDEVLQLDILSDADVAVVVSATLLHDLGLHLHDKGFIDLVDGRTNHRPVEWFSHSRGDLPWPEEWASFLHQAKRFSDEELSLIYGPCPTTNADAWCVRKPPLDTREWTKYDRFLIGEFLRRHHARLAHEIALEGFPGLSQGENKAFEFPEEYRDIIGATARSHGLPLRISLEYIRSTHGGNLRPLDTIPIYEMALIRIADLLQIDKKRAPAALLDLRSPQSKVSLDEWKKHDTIASVSFSHLDPEAVHVQVGNRHSLRTHLQLGKLINYLQREMDLSNAVLSEVYGRLHERRFNCVKLARSRVCSNIESSAYKSQLDYVPVEAKFRVDANLLVLLVEPLYGETPGIAVRELVQNAVDAVWERRRYCTNHGLHIQNLDFRNQEGDVVVSLEEDSSGTWHLRCSDTGAGMDLETVKDYFLRAGASYRHNPDWRAEFIDDSGRSTVTKSGRFGIGVFALFLIGSKFIVETRSIKDTTGSGFVFTASNNQDLVEINRRDLPIGTSISVVLRRGIGEQLNSFAMAEEEVRGRLKRSYEDYDDAVRWKGELPETEGLDCTWDWYTMSSPVVSRFVVRRDGSTNKLSQAVNGPSELEQDSSSGWHYFEGAGMGVLWTYDKKFPDLTCNGIVIKSGLIVWEPDTFSMRDFRSPKVSIIDPDSRLPLTLDRSRLTRRRAGFENELIADVAADLLAFLLASAPLSWKLNKNQRTYPLQSFMRYKKDSFWIKPLTWVASKQGTFPFIPSLIRMSKPKRIIIYGAPGDKSFTATSKLSQRTLMCPMVLQTTVINHALANFIVLKRVANLLGIDQLIGIRILIFCDKEYLSFGHDALCRHQVISSDAGRFVHEIKVGACKKSEIDVDIKDVIKSTFRKGLMAVIAEVFPATEDLGEPQEDIVAKMWLEVIGGPLLAYDQKVRTATLSMANKLPVVKRYLDNWSKVI